MIKVILDPYQLAIKTLNEARCVTQVSDYANTLVEIRNCLHTESTLTIYVTEHTVCRWLRNYLWQYDQVILEEHSPEESLRQLLGVTTLPPELASQTIINLRLLEIGKPEHPIEDIENYILGQCVALCWETISPSWEHIGDIASWYLEHSTGGKLGSPLDEWLREKQKQWSDSAVGDLSHTYNWLFKNPYARSKLVSVMKILSAYPRDVQLEFIADLDENILPTYVHIDKLPIISLPDVLINILRAKTKIYWKKRLPECSSIIKSLSEMSGRLLGEIESIFLYLSENMSQCDQSTISKLREHFNLLPDAEVFIDKLDTLSLKVDVPTAPDPEGTWDWQEWIKWATTKYLPYRTEAQNANVQNDLVDYYEEQYEEWLYNKYRELIHDPATPLIHSTAKRIQELIDEDSIVLWVIVDNLSWQNAMIFIRYMEEGKLFLTRSPIPRLSLIPSETATSKSSLVAGQLPYEIPKGISYEKMLWNRWSKEVVKYNHGDINMTAFVTEDASLYVYMYDDLDELAHGGFTDKNSLIQYSLRLLASRIKDAVSSLMIKGKVRVVVSSDHGSVKLPKGAYKATRPEFSELDEKHSRFAIVQNTKGLDPGHWHILEAKAFGLSDNYTVAKGYTYIETKPRALTHGGMTPEETIVAHLEFGSEKPSWIPLILAYRGLPLSLGHEEKIKLILQNPNNIPLADVRIKIPSQHLETEPFQSPAEDEISTSEFFISLHPKASIAEDETVTLETLIVYNVYGNTENQPFLIKLPIRRMWLPPEGKLFEEIA